MQKVSRALVLISTASLLALGGCRKPAPQPSADYDKAWRLYANLYARGLDDAYVSPAMDEVEALLKRVEPASSDAEAARKLIAQIQDGRKKVAQQRIEDAKLRASLRPDPVSQAPVPAMANLAPPPPPAPPPSVSSADAAADAGTPDAGAAPADPFAEGSPIANLNGDGCLLAGDPFKEAGSGRTGTTYRLAPSPACQSKLVGLQDQVVLVVDGRIYRRVAAKEIKVTEQPGQPAQGGAKAQGQPPPAAPAQAPSAYPGAPAAPAAPAEPYTGPPIEQPQPTSP